MYVCICKAVTENSIRQAVGAGHASVRQLREHLGVAGSCGKCATCAHDLVRDTLGVCDGGCGQETANA